MKPSNSINENFIVGIILIILFCLSISLLYNLSIAKDKELWERKLQVLREALKQVGKGGRRANTYRDDVVRSAVRLWEELTGEFAVQPAYKAGTSECTNSMVEFVADVLDLYDEFGMKGSVSKNSGAFWTRILSDDS